MTHASAPKPLTSAACGPLNGRAVIPGDKSISHRALMLAALLEARVRDELGIDVDPS